MTQLLKLSMKTISCRSLVKLKDFLEVICLNYVVKQHLHVYGLFLKVMIRKFYYTVIVHNLLTKLL